ncbi:MAG: UDP-N-acetylmuramoyl-tripeptide--D-alanyl-D-alanine ligase [Candidatus Bruticola sp.]
MAEIWKVETISTVLQSELPQQISKDLVLTGLFTDSRSPIAGGLFVPLRGERFNGHKFVESALKGGAAASLWSIREAGEIKPSPNYAGKLIYVDSCLQAYLLLSGYYLRCCGSKVMAVTGSVGKTTVKDFVRSILSQRYKVTATVANHNNEIGFAETLLSLRLDTDWAVTEMGMRARGEIERLAKIAVPSISIVSTIGESHLERLGSRREIALAKAELLDESSFTGVSILPADSDFYDLLHEHAKGRCVSFGVLNSQADWHLLETEECLKTTEMSEHSRGMCRLIWGQIVHFASPMGIHKVFLPVPGRHNCANMLAALAACSEAGVSLEEGARGLASCQLTGKRLQIEAAPDGTVLIDDSYNAAPSSVKAALELMPKLPSLLSKIGLGAGQTGDKRRCLAVLGDMLELGAEEKELHRQLGKLCANSGLDMLIGVGELSVNTVKEAQSCGLHSLWASNWEQAYEMLSGVRQPGDCLLIKASHSVNLSAMAQKIRDVYTVE